MARLAFRSSTALALAAAVSMVATPVAAAPFHTAPVVAAAPVATPWDVDYNVANNHRGWGGGYGGYHGYRHRGGGISTGDVLAGVLVLGGIAAIASAASNSNNNRDREDARSYPDYRGDAYPNRDDRQDYRDRDDRQGYRDRDDRNSSYSSDSGGQWNDDDYARAREQQGYAQPYPGEE